MTAAPIDHAPRLALFDGRPTDEPAESGELVRRSVLADPLNAAHMPDYHRAVLRMVLDAGGALTVSPGFIAERFGVTERTVFRALAELEIWGMITRRGPKGRTQTITVGTDIDDKLRALCQCRPPTGGEYVALADPDKARDDRARYCFAVGRGPRWAMERGAKLARGLDPDVERNDPLPW